MSNLGDSRPAEYPENVRPRTGRRVPRSFVASALAGASGIGLHVVLFAIQSYRRIVSPLIPPSCRFEPSCSRYAQEALRRHGLWRGARLAAGRVLRCHPFRPGGWDPVP
jgi:putative membrane protein insertion efficiency factor